MDIQRKKSQVPAIIFNAVEMKCDIPRARLPCPSLSTVTIVTQDGGNFSFLQSQSFFEAKMPLTQLLIR
jgi:hypothetical protein